MEAFRRILARAVQQHLVHGKQQISDRTDPRLDASTVSPLHSQELPPAVQSRSDKSGEKLLADSGDAHGRRVQSRHQGGGRR